MELTMTESRINMLPTVSGLQSHTDTHYAFSSDSDSDTEYENYILDDDNDDDYDDEFNSLISSISENNHLANIKKNNTLLVCIKSFIFDQPKKIRHPMIQLINNFLFIYTYVNGESLERHEWDMVGCIELIEGAVQGGKRELACVIVWFLNYIIKMPVLYIFRNITIDKQLLMNDVIGCNENCFNIKYIKKYLYIEGDKNIWKNYKIKEWKDIKDYNLNEHWSNSDMISSTDVYCCLMGHIDLKNIYDALIEHSTINNNEKMKLAVIVDEADLVEPSSCNDNNSIKKDIKDTTQREQYLNMILKLSRYSLLISGTGQGAIYNSTTRLSNDEEIINNLHQVHVMKMADDYYGNMNGKINIVADQVTVWWDQERPYNIVDDYKKNMKGIIEEIENNNNPYNSLLIREELICENQAMIADLIADDFHENSIMVFNGEALIVIYPIKFHSSFKEQIIKDKRLNNTKILDLSCPTIYGINNTHFVYKIALKKHKNTNIKQFYKVFRAAQIHGSFSRTIITISGNYASRGYSFTSDNYGKYELHLTHQYSPFHSTTCNATSINQNMRIQGKYSDMGKNNMMEKPVLFTTNRVKNLLEKAYIPYINMIRNKIMNYKGHSDLTHCIESITYLQFKNNSSLKNYLPYLYPKKLMKNLKSESLYDKSHGGIRIAQIDQSDIVDISVSLEKFEKYIADLNIDKSLPVINKIKKTTKKEYIDKYGEYKYTYTDNKDEIENNGDSSVIFESREDLKKYADETKFTHKQIDKNENGFNTCIVAGKRKVYSKDDLCKEIKTHSSKANMGWSSTDPNKYTVGDTMRRLYCFYTDLKDRSTDHYFVRISKIGTKTSEKHLPIVRKRPIKKDTIIGNKHYVVENDHVIYSMFKDDYTPTKGYKETTPSEFLYISPDGWIIYYDLKLDDKQKKDAVKLKCVTTSPSDELISEIYPNQVLSASNNLYTELSCNPTQDQTLPLTVQLDKDDEIRILKEKIKLLENKNNPKKTVKSKKIKLTQCDASSVKQFIDSTFTTPDKPNRRIGINTITDKYNKWCKDKNIKPLTRNKLKIELELHGYVQEKTKGQNEYDENGYRGYNICLL